MPDPLKFGSPQEVMAFVKQQGIRIADLKFVDMPGTWQHFSIPSTELDEDAFTKGVGFDGSSIRGFQHIQESDMLLIPDPTTAFMDTATLHPTISLICNIKDPISGAYSRDPRYIAQKAEAYLKTTGIAEKSFWGPELEFFIFDNIRYDQTPNSGYYFVDSVEGQWNTGSADGPNLGYKPRYKEGYFPVAPTDTLQDIRSEAVLKMIDAGIHIEAHHHEVATAGQGEIDMRFDSLVKMADQVLLLKYILKNTAAAHGKTVTFMPKPLFQDNGTGMHTHQSLWDGDKPLFYEAGGYANLSQMALWYVGGLLKHAASILAFAAPTTNSYRRLVPGYEAPVNLAFSARNRSAAVRIPMYFDNPKAKRLEFRCPDAASNPYLTFSACLMAGLDGIQNKIHPGEPMEMDIYELEGEEAARIPQVPGSLDAALNALEADHEFLLKGDVFTKDVIDTWIGYKRIKEVDAIRLRPHPYEFALYYDV
ncbi:MAG: Glutamine synthetase [Nitrospira sp.]|nr:Glutamine synthetase [Nitrospira sp.]